MAKIFFSIFQVSYVIYFKLLLNLIILTTFSIECRALLEEEIKINLPYTELKDGSIVQLMLVSRKMCCRKNVLSEDVKRTMSKGIILEQLNNCKI